MSKTKENKLNEEKMGVIDKFKNFFYGVGVESKRIHWTTKKDLVRYFFATFAFVLFFSLFFYVIDIVFALLHSLIG